MALSEFNPHVNGGLRQMFDILDVDINPKQIDMSKIIPVVDMQFGGQSSCKPDELVYGSSSTSIAGVATGTVYAISPLGYATAPAAAGLIIPTQRRGVLLTGVGMHVNFDAAGAAAMAGLDFWVHLRMGISTTEYVHKWWANYQVDVDDLSYFPGLGKSGANASSPALHRSNVCWVPPSHYLSFVVNTQTGGNFPANTTISIRVGGYVMDGNAPILYGL